MRAGRLLYWTPGFVTWYRGTSRYFGMWYIDTDTDDARRNAFLISPSEAPPTGSAVWREWCNDLDAWNNAWLKLTPAFPNDGGVWCEVALASLAPTLTTTCCAEEDGPGCGHNDRPVDPSPAAIDDRSLAWAF